MPAPYHGSCLCGTATYDVTAEPAKTILCFCTHCLKGSGATSQLVAVVSASSLAITKGKNNISIFELRDTYSGRPKNKSFCETCGCTLWTEPEAGKGKFLCVRPSLWNCELLKPSNEFFTERRPKWMPAIAEATQFSLEGHLE